MQKKKITAFLLALAMVSAMALPVFAQEPNPQAETAASIAVVETATPETAATEEPKVDAEPAEDNVKEDADTYDAPPENGWYQEYPGGPWYWYENGVRQGTTGRGKEIYDPKSDAWYWLDAVQGGAMTTNKDVYQDSNGGKWVRYDANGHMVKGWNTNEKGTYYFDLVTGAMAWISSGSTSTATSSGTKAASARAPLAAARKSMTPLPMPGTGWIPSITAQWLSARMSIRTPTAASGFAMMPTAI